MRALIADYTPWVISIVVIAMTWLQGKKDSRAWVVAMAGQVLWFVWIFASSNWGLLPSTLVLCVLYARNYMEWVRLEESDDGADIGVSASSDKCQRCKMRHPTSGACCGVYDEIKTLAYVGSGAWPSSRPPAPRFPPPPAGFAKWVQASARPQHGVPEIPRHWFRKAVQRTPERVARVPHV